MVDVNTSQPIDFRYVEKLPSGGTYSGFYQVGDGLRLIPLGIYYWSLPREFLGDRVSCLDLPGVEDGFKVICKGQQPHRELSRIAFIFGW